MLIEVQHLLATDMDQGVLRADAIPSEESLSAVCAGLVRIEDEGPKWTWRHNRPIWHSSCKVIKFVHHTTQHYFSEGRRVSFYEWRLEALRLSLHTLRIAYGGPEGDMERSHGAGNLSPPTTSMKRGVESAPWYRGSAFDSYARWFLTSTPEYASDIQAPGIPELALSVLGIPGVARNVMKNVYHTQKSRVRPVPGKSNMKEALKRDLSAPLLNNFNGIPLPHVAASIGFVETLKQSLTPHGLWSINAKDFHGLTPLTYATMFGVTSSIKVLLDMGASVQESVSVSSPLDRLVSTCGSLAGIVAWLDAPGMTEDLYVSALIQAAKAGNQEAITVFLKRGLDKFPGDQWHSRVFLSAIESGDHESLRRLFKNGMKYTAGSAESPTLLFNAVQTNSYMCALELLKHNVDVNQRNKYGEHALFEAARRNFLSLAYSLVESGADLNIESTAEEGITVKQILARSVSAGDVSFTEGIHFERYKPSRIHDLILKSRNPFALCHVVRKRGFNQTTVQSLPSKRFSDLPIPLSKRDIISEVSALE